MTRPTESDYAPPHAAYVELVDEDDILSAMQEQSSATQKLLATLDEQRAAYRYGTGKWSIKEVIGHITDAERVFAYRLVTIARGDETALPGFEENAWVAAADFDSRLFTEILADWVTTRNSTLALARSLSAAAWERRGTANNLPITARALLYLLLGHVEHHCAVLKQRYFEPDDR